jgi:hypothetical protein
VGAEVADRVRALEGFGCLVVGECPLRS